MTGAGLRARLLSRELRQQGQRRLRNLHLKSEFAQPQTVSHLFPSRLIRQMLENCFGRLCSKGLYQSSGKGKESRCLVFPSSTKCEFFFFHVVVMQRRQRNVQ